MLLAPSSATRWFYVDSGRRHGPIALDELIERLLRSQLSSDTPVWHAGLAEWVKANTVPEISSELPPPVPAVELPAPDPTLPPPESAADDEADDGGALTEVVPIDVPPLPAEGRRYRRRRHRRHGRGSEPRWDLLTILAVALIVLVMVLWRMFRQGDAIPSGIVGLG